MPDRLCLKPSIDNICGKKHVHMSTLTGNNQSDNHSQSSQSSTTRLRSKVRLWHWGTVGMISNVRGERDQRASCMAFIQAAWPGACLEDGLRVQEYLGFRVRVNQSYVYEKSWAT